MSEYMNKINEAYKIISAMTVSGNNVDSVAAVRAILREVYSSMEKQEVTVQETEVVTHE